MWYITIRKMLINTVASTLIISALLLSTVTLVFAQQSQQPPQNLHIEDSDEIIKQIQSQLMNSRLKDYQLFANGTAIYEVQLLNTLDASTGTRETLLIHTEHRFTPAQGYIYNQSGIFNRDGERFVLAVFD